MNQLRLLTALGILIGVSCSGYAQARPEIAITDKSPSSDLSSPTALEFGEVVKGRLGDSSQTGKFHFWLVNFPVGGIKVVLDVRRADLSDGNIGGALDWLSVDGEKLNFSCGMNTIEYRSRSICGLDVKKPLKAVLRYSNGFTVSDYWLGLFKEGTPIPSPYFSKPPAVQSMQVGEPVVATLEGAQPQARDAWYSAKLPAGDYKLSVEYRIASGQKGNVGGALHMFGPDGDFRSVGNQANDLDSSPKAISRMSLADETTVLFRTRAGFTREIVTFKIEAVKE